MRIVSVLVISSLGLLFSAQVRAEGLAAKIEAARKARLSESKAALADLQQKVKKLRGAQLQAVGNQIKGLKAQIKHFENPKAPYEPQLDDKLTVGGFGKLPSGNAPRVVRIVSDTEFVAEFVPEKPTAAERRHSSTSGGVEAGTADAFAVMVDSARRAAANKGSHGKVYIRGIATKDINNSSYATVLPFIRSLWGYYFEVSGVKEHGSDGKIPVLEVVR